MVGNISLSYNSINLGIVLIVDRNVFLPGRIRKPVCDAHEFVIGDVFYTSNHIFEYSIYDILGPGVFTYSAAPLGSICFFWGYNITVDRIQRNVESTVRLDSCASCRREALKSSLCKASVFCQGNNDQIILVYPSRNSRYTTIPTGPSAIIDALSQDLLIGVLAESATTPINILQVGLTITCDGYVNLSPTPAQVSACYAAPVSFTNVQIIYANDSVNIDPNLPPTLAESIPNALQGVVASSLIDIGILNNNSIFLSASNFNATITPNTAISSVLEQNPPFFPSALWNSPSSASLASQMRMDPYFNFGLSKVVTSYLCHEQRRKNAFSLIICTSFIVQGLTYTELHSLLSCYCG